MTALILISAPVFLLFAALFGRRLFGKKTAWKVVNSTTSLLLLLYFLATTGLGMFWVAKQELPVFDLHYLFGYITCLLVCIHVYLNRKQIKTGFKRRAVQKEPPPPARRAVASFFRSPLTVAAVAGFVCFWMGGYLNRNFIPVCQERIGAGNPTDAMPDRENVFQGGLPPVDHQMIGNGENKVPLAIYYYNATKNTRWNIIQNRQGFPGAGCPSVFKTYPADQNVVLPSPNLNRPDLTGEVIERQKRTACAFQKGSMTAGEFSSILMLNDGITGTLEYPGIRYDLRSAPSAGALYPTITYVLINTVEGIDPGLYHYSVKEHQLHPIDVSPDLAEKLLAAVPMPVLLENANVVFIYTANYYRSSWKYGERAYRYILLDTGHIAKNALLGAETFGYQGNLLGDFDDQCVNTLLQIDDNEEGTLLLLPLGKGKEPAPTALKKAVQAAPRSLSGKAGELILFTQGHTCLKLDNSQQIICPTVHNRLYEKAYPARPVIDLPDRYNPGERLTTTLMNRRSVRNWDDKAITRDQLSSLLYYSFGVKNENGICLGDPGISGSHFLNLYLIINRVEGIDPGVYHYNRLRHNLSQIQRGDFHRAIYEASLSQSVVGRSCVCFVLTTSNARLNRHPDGDRSLRYAGIEAGMIGENIYLQSEALGLGCTGIGAYFDNEVSKLINVQPEEESITYLLAIGVKKTLNSPAR